MVRNVETNVECMEKVTIGVGQLQEIGIIVPLKVISHSYTVSENLLCSRDAGNFQSFSPTVGD